MTLLPRQGFFSTNAQPAPYDYFSSENIVFCLSLHAKCPQFFVYTQRASMSHRCAPSCAYRLLSKPANVHVANMRAHQSTKTSTANPWPCFSSLAVSALRESKRRHKALSVTAVCLNLTLVCVCACVCMSVCVWRTTSKNDGVAQLL